MQLRDLVEQVAGFDSAAPREKIKILSWWLHAHGKKELFGALPKFVDATASSISKNRPLWRLTSREWLRAKNC
jgi:hypothetical protein